MTPRRAIVLLALIVALGAARLGVVRLGKQPDGGFIVSTGQRIDAGGIAFTGRPIDLALHPMRDLIAVLNKTSVLLIEDGKAIPGSGVPLAASAGFRGLVWSPDGVSLYASTDRGHVQPFAFDGKTLNAGEPIAVAPPNFKGNPVPGGMCLTRAGTRLFVAAANRNAVVEIDTTTRTIVRTWPVETLPFEPRLSADESTLIVSNWGGRLPKPGDITSKSQKLDVVSGPVGSAATGTVSLIDLKTGATRHVDVGIHPTAIVTTGNFAYVANAMSDSISEIDLNAGKVTRTFALRYGSSRLLGSMPNALALRGETLYAADGGDNALAEIDLGTGKVRGFRPAGYFPTAVALRAMGKPRSS